MEKFKSEMFKNKDLRTCKCPKQEKAIFYCFEGCGKQKPKQSKAIYFCIDPKRCKCNKLKQSDIFCCISDLDYQREYCIDCGEDAHSSHGGKQIVNLVSEIYLFHLAPLYTKIISLEENVKEKFKPYIDLVMIIEEMHQKTVSKQFYNADRKPYFMNLFSELQKTVKSMNELKDTSEKLIDRKQLTNLLKLYDRYHKLNNDYQFTKALKNFDTWQHYERYKEVFQYPFEKGKISGLSLSSFVIFKDFKNLFIESLMSNEINNILARPKQEVVDLLIFERFIIQEVELNNKFGQQLTPQFQNAHNEIAGPHIQRTQIEQVISKFQDTIERQNAKIKQLESLLFQEEKGQNNQDIQQEHIQQEHIQNREQQLNFNGKYWNILFAINKEDTFDYFDKFWTQKQEIPSQAYTNQINFLFTFKLNAFWEKNIKTILIISENRKFSILHLPSRQKSLMGYFIDKDSVQSLVHESGASDPLELFGKQCLPQSWYINSSPLNYLNRLRLGGLGQKVKSNQKLYNNPEFGQDGFYRSGGGLFQQMDQLHLSNTKDQEKLGVIVCGL